MKEAGKYPPQRLTLASLQKAAGSVGSIPTQAFMAKGMR